MTKRMSKTITFYKHPVREWGALANEAYDAHQWRLAATVWSWRVGIGWDRYIRRATTQELGQEIFGCYTFILRLNPFESIGYSSVYYDGYFRSVSFLWFIFSWVR